MDKSNLYDLLGTLQVFVFPQSVRRIFHSTRDSRELGWDQDGEPSVMHELDVVPVVVTHESHSGRPSKLLVFAGHLHRFSIDIGF